MIPISQPSLSDLERQFLLDAFDSGWISSKGSYIDRLETAFSETYSRPCTLVANGTVALHLLLLKYGIGLGDEVIVPALTFVATANSVLYCGATPRFADVNEKSWNIDLTSIKNLVNKKTKAIIVTHLYGQPVDLEPIYEFCQEHKIILIEDAAEAFGARYKNSPVGSPADGAILSMFGNKTISTGEGGLVISKNMEDKCKIDLLKGQGMDPNRR